MLITFSSQSSGDILMLAEHALLVMRAMGRAYETMPEQGVITHTQLQESIDCLEKAIQQQVKKEDPYALEDELEEKGEEKPHPVEEAVNLSRRAFPLLEMMKEALKSSKDDEVVWRSANAW